MKEIAKSLCYLHQQKIKEIPFQCYIYKKLENIKLDFEEEKTLIHGDFFFPNIIIEQNKLEQFVK